LAWLPRQADGVAVEDARRWQVGQARRERRRETKVENDGVRLFLGQDGPLGIDILLEIGGRQPTQTLVGAKDVGGHFGQGPGLESGLTHHLRALFADGKNSAVSAQTPGISHGQAAADVRQRWRKGNKERFHLALFLV
jgi:hypothetical protein